MASEEGFGLRLNCLEIKRLYRIRRTICEMLADRKYNVGDTLTLEEFKDKFGGQTFEYDTVL